MAAVGYGIDPTLDAAGVLGPECFLCGRKGSDHTFGGTSIVHPQLAGHRVCIAAEIINGKSSQRIVLEYERRIADIVSVKRAR